MKIDAEGAELMLLEGARKTIETFHPKIILSTHGERMHYQCIQWLIDLGYRLEPIPAGMSLDETRSVLAV